MFNYNNFPKNKKQTIKSMLLTWASGLIVILLMYNGWKIIYIYLCGTIAFTLIAYLTPNGFYEGKQEYEWKRISEKIDSKKYNGYQIVISVLLGIAALVLLFVAFMSVLLYL